MKQSAAELDHILSQPKIVLVGNSYSLDELDLSLLRDVETLSCNRILLHPTFVPTSLMISDREVYCQERDSGRLEEYVLNAGTLLLSETIFNPKIRGRRADMSHDRQRNAQPEPDFDWWAWRVGSWNTKLHFETFKEYLCSCANIVGPMIQAAAIMGVAQIGIVGVDMQWPKDSKSHFFGDGRELGAFPFVSLKMTMNLLSRAKKLLEMRGVRVVSLSPIRATPFAQVFGNHDYEEFVKGD